MSKIAFVIDAGNAQVNQIFTGVFGTIEDGQFKVDESLKRIHLLSLLTPEALRAQGIDLSSSVAEIEIDDSAAGALKATMLAALKSQWVGLYEKQSLGSMPSIAMAALSAERDMVKSAVEQGISDSGLTPRSLVLSRSFVNAYTTPVITDEELYRDVEDHKYEYKDDQIQTGVQLSAKLICRGMVEERVWIAANANPSAAPWQILASDQAQVEALDALPELAQTSDLMGYASGELRTKIQIYANDAQIQAVGKALIELPASLQSRLGLAENAKFASLELHPVMRETGHGPQEDQIVTPSVAAPAFWAALPPVLLEPTDSAEEPDVAADSQVQDAPQG